MPKPSADLKQTKLSFAPVRKTPPPIVISSPNRKSVSDLADNFEQQSTARITRSRSNLSVPIELITPIAPLKRAASLDNTMSNKASEVPRKGEKTKGAGGASESDTQDPDHDAGEVGLQPSNAELMEMLRGLKQDIKTEIKSELAEFRTETSNSMANLQANVKGLGENQKSIESSIEVIKKEQDSLTKQVKDLREE